MATLPRPVVRALSEERVERLLRARTRLSDLSSEAASKSTWAVLVPLFSSSRADLLNQLKQASSGDELDWLYVEGPTEDGRRTALGTNLIGGTSQLERLVHLQLFDLHPRMLGWYLTALWRASELTDDLVSSLRVWHVVSSASLARSLFEGSFAFIAESTEMRAEWSEMKRTGPPNASTARVFRGELNRLLVQGQYGTRIGERGVRRPQIKRLIQQGVRHAGLELEPLMEQYNWLCDAVHPSFGFQTAYTTRQLRHRSGSHIVVEAGRGLDAIPQPGDTDPTVAIAAVDAASSALEELTNALPQFLAVVDDYGLTTGVCFASRLNYWRRFDKPGRNDPCPCGQGRKFKSCIHDWGGPEPMTSVEQDRAMTR